ncbi:MAG: phage holin family protein [Bacteroidetes bacterium]|nr:phage holin family protein [Bacteroidota bacterium]
MPNPVESNFEELKNSLQELLENRIRLVKISFTEKLSKLLYLFVFLIVVLAVLSLLMTFLSIMMASWLGQALNNPMLGNLIVAAFYVLLLVLLILFRKALILDPITRMLSAIILSEDYEDK